MTLPKSSAVATCALLLVGCAGKPETAHVAGPDEAAAIIAPIIPTIPSVKTCVGRDLRPPLEDRRRYAKIENQSENVLQRGRSWFEQLLFGRERTRSNWSHSVDGKTLQLRSEDADHLDRLLRRATTAQLSYGKVVLTLPRNVRACTDQDEKADVLTGPPVYRFYYSQPVVIGNVAFVEESGVCGGLCGSGSLKALIKHGEKWSLAADQMTWIA